jgi:hypothetical protein
MVLSLRPASGAVTRAAQPSEERLALDYDACIDLRSGQMPPGGLTLINAEAEASIS